MAFDRMERRAAEYLSDRLHLQEDALIQTMLIHMIGSRTLVVENFRNLLEYTDVLIRIQGKDGRLRVEGKKLAIQEYNPESIYITGRIRQISFEQSQGTLRD